MQVTSANLDRDASHSPIGGLYGFLVSKTMAFAGGTTNDMGDYDGTGNPATIFTVTGDVVATIFGVCSENLAGANATLEVGIVGNTAALIAQTTATGIDNGQVWIDATTATVQGLPSAQVLTGGTDIIQTVATANITDGTITYYCFFRPLSSTGNVIAA